MRWMLLFSLTLAGCGTEDIPLGTTTSDTGAPVGFDVGVPDTQTDAEKDAPIIFAVLEATLHDVLIQQSCTPPVASDPVRAKLTVRLDNPAAGPFGTLRASKASFLRGDVRVATVSFPEIALTPPMPGSVSATIEKTEGSLEPKGGCDLLPCGTPVKVEVVLTGEVTSVTASSEVTVECSP